MFNHLLSISSIKKYFIFVAICWLTRNCWVLILVKIF